MSISFLWQNDFYENVRCMCRYVLWTFDCVWLFFNTLPLNVVKKLPDTRCKRWWWWGWWFWWWRLWLFQNGLFLKNQYCSLQQVHGAVDAKLTNGAYFLLKTLINLVHMGILVLKALHCKLQVWPDNVARVLDFIVKQSRWLRVETRGTTFTAAIKGRAQLG